MPLDVDRTRKLLKNFDFRKLFIDELGWDRHTQDLDVTVDGKTYQLAAIAHKRGMVAFECPSSDSLPGYPVRRKIDQQVTKSVREHILIFTDAQNTMQNWQWVKREAGRPAACREHTYHKNQPGDALIQKLQNIAFSLEEEEKLTLVDVAGRTRAGFDVERVTKRFYDRFKTEHGSFLAFIKGIPDQELQRWYASVMLNRLMFIYFIQRKGFLDSNADYLRSKLTESKQRSKDKYYSGFLCPLFFEGFAKKESDRSGTVNKLLGKIPYLNGGLFLKHQIEELHGKTIQVPDSAFERLFDFFDQYHWHLDERPLRSDNEINPDVLGYIFEKYINQKQMGAYYTKEDITEYISKNTVIPFLFDAAKQKCKIAFESPTIGHSRPDRESGVSLDSTIWNLLQLDPDQYIYEAVKKGVELPLPDEIAKGLKDVSQRTEWNKPAPAEYALPTEIWREVVARRKRYEEVCEKLAKDEIRDINDFITYNLDIRQLAQDVIETSEGPELLRAFYHAIEKVTVLDPTCGSGAFLFAALNILEPLYEACLDRMQVFLDELDRSGEKHRPEKYSDFRKILSQIEKHPNLRYFILKSIIVNNLYGVDIMEEAIEICKLRLFLKLVAQIDDVNKIEPLPDIDFNIRAGNTLVGFATYEEVKHAVTSKLDFENTMGRIGEQAQEIDGLFKRFHEQQTELGGEVTPGDKQELRKRLQTLENELNQYLADEYGVDLRKKASFEKWHDSHKPFHWFIEFYGIIKDGGFDVIIGNPPYVELNALSGYVPLGYTCFDAGNLYALVIERCYSLCAKTGRQGFIVPVSSVSTDRYVSLQRLLTTRPLHYCSFDDRPSRLFDGLEHIRLTIHVIGSAGTTPYLFSNRYNKWQALERPVLFDCLNYSRVFERLIDASLPKFSSDAEENIIKGLSSQKQRLSAFYRRNAASKIFYSRKVGYFLQALDFEPMVKDGSGKRRPPSEFKELTFESERNAKAALCCLNSNLFYWFVTVFSDCRHVNKREIDNFPVELEQLSSKEPGGNLIVLADQLMQDLRDNSEATQMRFAHDTLTVQCIYPKRSKPIIDEIDRVLAKHYDFTDEELDFIINYDIKYRMGKTEDD
ncbi:MAG: DNA methyltransferase [bacterium]